MKTLSVGILGFGRIGLEHAGWIAQSQGLRVAAIADPTAARRRLAQEFRGHHRPGRVPRIYDSAEELLADRAVDIIAVCTPTAMHFEHAAAALAAGKHVMVEKPLALDLEHASSLVHLARKRRRVLSVFHNRRWDLDYLMVKAGIDAGTFGRLINVESRLHQWCSCVGPAAPEWRPNWRNEAAFGGGGLYDWGTHFVDQLWRLMYPARPLRVFAQLRGNVWTSDCDDFARICIDFDNGAVGLLEINTTTTRPLPRWHVDGTAGCADSPYSLSFDVRQWARLQFVPADGSAPAALPSVAGALNEVQIWDRFDAAVRANWEPAVSAASVLPTMALLDAARQSSASGQSIELPDTRSWMY